MNVSGVVSRCVSCFQHRRENPPPRWRWAALALLGALAALPPVAEAQEPAACLSPDPAARPPSSRPYFLVIADTSGSMTQAVGSPTPIASSCGYGSDRRAHLRCALRNAFQAYAGQANFGLGTFPRRQSSCGAACFGTCTYDDYPGNATNPGCGSGTGVNRRGLFIRVPVLQDAWWQTPPPASNVPTLLSWVDNNCSGNTELFADGLTPLNGALRDARRYFSSTGWTAQDSSVTYPTPLASQDRACRSVNVILITDGDETCDTQADAVAAASDLYNNGVTIGGRTFRVPVYVVNFLGGTQSATDQIASAGGTGTSFFASTEAQLSTALSGIFARALRAETCDNLDNDCNGCTDEGFSHYCHSGQGCCAWATPAQRASCLASYQASITVASPSGNTALLPCTTAAQQAQPADWLCYEPTDSCDSIDNDCDGTVDEGQTRCGNPAHCPIAETCNGLDDDCDGVADDGVCGGCVPSPEVCDGCDNDCDGLIDDGIASVACGLATPPNCVGTQACAQKPNPGGVPGACVGGAWSACGNSPQGETCDGIDNDCDGVADDGVAPVACVPAGVPSGLVYGGTSQCVLGSRACGGTCTGFVGPSVEVCDGIDNDCDGQVDEGVSGVGQACGVSQPPCTAGTTMCINGALVCVGGVSPQPELCDGVDNDCDGAIDDAPLADAPPAGTNGCWDGPGNCCTFGGRSWCPPPGATCTDVGTLTGDQCAAGRLACAAGAWVCRGVDGPSAETCNGFDDDCDGNVDEGSVPGAGAVCGIAMPPCQTGVTACVGGALECVGGVPPSAEACNGVDDDCDGSIDDGLATGGACTVPYDTLAFPGERTSGVCAQGVSQCDGAGGTTCAGGVGPAPEVCNGIDDDCDGSVDEAGTAPDGVDGTASPLDPEVVVGAACGTGVGECSGGVQLCTDGAVVCTSAPGAEACNCLDDDCDGTRDEDVALCATGRACSEHEGSCGCRTTCDEDADCPAGWSCTEVTTSSSGAASRACVRDLCAGCESRWIESDGVVACAPEGTELPGCVRPPVCVCTAAGCGSPCAGVTCAEGTACAERGPQAGTCITPRCPEVPCVGCGQLCAPDGACVDDPCAGDPCAPGETCVPSEDLRSRTCEGERDAGAADAGARDGGGALDGGSMEPVAGAPGSESGGCGCAAPGRSSSGAPWALGLALAAILVARRRRRELGRGAALVALALVVASASGCGDDDGVAGDAGTIDAGAMDAGEGPIDAGTDDAGAIDAGTPDAGTDACVPAEEVCNGRDDDCDGTADDVDETDPRTCGGCGNDCTIEAVGCVRSQVACDSGQCVCMECAPGLYDDDGDGRCERECDAVASDDVSCDGRDSDCDGLSDEDVEFCAVEHCGGCGTACSAPHATMACASTGPTCRNDASCFIDACVCTGPGNCWFDLDGDVANGCEYACAVSNGGVELCNGIDDDCDGSIDGAVVDPAVGVACTGDPDGLCAQPAHEGTTACVGGAIVCTGDDVLLEGDVGEVCNGVDDDCDGSIDDAPSDVGMTCGSSATRPCRIGRVQCVGGAPSCVGAIEPATETCNGVDDDCDGTIDDAPSDVGGACNVPFPPPAGATSPCRAGTLVCTGGALQCSGSIGPSSVTDACGDDSNCDGTLTAQPSLTSSVDHCGACGNSCYAGAVHATWACTAGTCQFQGCQPGYYDLDGDRRCEYACTFVSAQESCNGVDDDCNGMIDESVVAPSPVQVCGVSPIAGTPECTTGVSVACTSGAWRCTFPAGVCAGGCSAGDEICDALDNDCDGFVNETTPDYGQPCASDDGLPAPGHGACRTTGTYVCNGAAATVCSAVRADCATLPGGCTELCDGIDNDCDGTVDDTFANKGSNASHFVRPTVTRIAAALWMYSYEASRPSATTVSQGSGNGFWTSAPAGRTIDRTRACSVPSRLPWTGVTPQEAAQVCTAMGGRLCTTADFQTGCGATQSCQYGYNPRGAACTSAYTSSRYCNIGPSYDFSPGIAGDQDGLLVTASSSLQNCWADWSSLQGNTAATNKIFDITGNVREITASGAGAFVGMGGSYLTASEAGASCSFTGYPLESTSQAADLGFRCCFTSDPTL